MKIILQLFLSWILLNAPQTHAQPEGHDVGNGGDAVVCYKDLSKKKMITVQILDYWERPLIGGVNKPLNLGNPEMSVQDKIKLAVSRFRTFDPYLAEHVQTVALALADNINRYIVANNELLQIDDSNPNHVMPFQSNCYLEQFAVRYKNVITGDTRFAISNKLYNFSGTSNDDRAGLLLHEAIYSYAISNGAKNSNGARYFNYFIASKFFKNIDENYYSVLEKSQIDSNKLKKVIYKNFKTQSDAIYIRNDKTLKDEELLINSRLKFKFKRNSSIGGMDFSGLWPGFEHQLGFKFSSYFDPVSSPLEASILVDKVWVDFLFGSGIIIVGANGHLFLSINEITFISNKSLSLIHGQVTAQVTAYTDFVYDLDFNQVTALFNSSNNNTLKVDGTSCQYKQLSVSEGGDLEGQISECKLKFAGTDLLTNVNGKVRLNQTGAIVKYDFIHDLKIINVDGIEMTLEHFDNTQTNGRFTALGNKLFSAYPIEKIMTEPGVTNMNAYCHSLNSRFTEGVVIRTGSKFVSSSEKFHNISNGQDEVKTDELVEYVDLYRCQGEFSFNL